MHGSSRNYSLHTVHISFTILVAITPLIFHLNPKLFSCRTNYLKFSCTELSISRINGLTEVV